MQLRCTRFGSFAAEQPAPRFWQAYMCRTSVKSGVPKVELDLLQDRRRPGTFHLAELAAEEMYAEHRQREADEAALDQATAAEQQQQPSASQAVPPAHGAGAARSGTVPDAVDEVSWSVVGGQRPATALRFQVGLTSGQQNNGSGAMSAGSRCCLSASCSSLKMASQPGVRSVPASVWSPLQSDFQYDWHTSAGLEARQGCCTALDAV